MIDYKIRPASQSDIIEICEIEDSSFTEPYPSLLLRRLLRECSDSFLIASTPEGKVLGYCVWSVDRNSAHLISIAVSLHARRMGVGTSLMESLFESLIAQGVGELWLEVRLENKEAIGLYGGLGFREVSVIPNYYSDGSDALRMRKAFAPKLVGGQGV